MDGFGVSRHARWLGYGLFALAVWLIANALLGPFLTGVIDYHYSESMTNQGIGLDVVALFGAAPIALLAGVLLLRGHRAGPVLALIPATFAAYMAPQYLIGPEYLTLPGNNERFFLFHLGLFVLAVALIITAWVTIRRHALRPATTRSDRRRSWVMFGVAAFILLGRWLPLIVELTAGEPTNTDYLENPTALMLIGLLDLGLVVPAATVVGIGLLRGYRWARKASYAVIGWFALVPAAVASMAITMQINGDPNADETTTLVFAIAAAVFTLGAMLLYVPLFRAESGVIHLPETLPSVSYQPRAEEPADEEPQIPVGT